MTGIRMRRIGECVSGSRGVGYDGDGGNGAGLVGSTGCLANGDSSTCAPDGSVGIERDMSGGGGGGGISSEVCSWSCHDCSRAWAKARTFAKRRCGSLASATMTACSTEGGIPGAFSCNGGGGTNICWLAISEKDP